jgi:hypothetical protein
MYNNFGDADSTTRTYSSQLSAFSVSSAFDSYRFTGWRPSGAFEITDANNKLYINDGADKTATLANATYTTGTLLAAQIQTALNAVSSNWTCTYSTSTYKFTVDRSSGTKILRKSQTTSAIWDDIGYLGAVDAAATAADVVRIHTSEWIHFDLLNQYPLDAFIAIGSISTAFPIPETATVTIKANNIDDFSSPPFSETVTPTSEGIFKFFEATDTSYRYWKVEFEDRENPNGPSVFDIRVIYLGDAVAMERNIGNGFTASRVDRSNVSESEGGSLFFREKPKYWTISASIDWTKPADRKIISDLYDYVGNTRPFFVALDPDAAISDTVAEFTKYVTFDGNLEKSHLLYNYFSLPISFREVIG